MYNQLSVIKRNALKLCCVLIVLICLFDVILVKIGRFLLWKLHWNKKTMLRRLVKFSHILQRVQHTRSLSVTVCRLIGSTNTETDKTTHFGFETVTEAEKGQKGLQS